MNSTFVKINKNLLDLKLLNEKIHKQNKYEKGRSSTALRSSFNLINVNNMKNSFCSKWDSNSNNNTRFYNEDHIRMKEIERQIEVNNIYSSLLFVDSNIPIDDAFDEINLFKKKIKSLINYNVRILIIQRIRCLKEKNYY